MDRDDGAFRADEAFNVADFVSVDDEVCGEIDLEGLDIACGALWLVGSHSALRTRIRKSLPDTEVPDRLSKIEYPLVRRFLARIPVEANAGAPIPARSAAGSNGSRLTAASLRRPRPTHLPARTS